MEQEFFTYYNSPIGILKVSCTDTFISGIEFCEDASNLPESTTAPPLLNQAVEELIEYFNGSRRSFDLPVHQNGTAFQERVWSELLNLQFGKTISYMDLAKRLGDPKAIRAAASTNGKNKICIVVPCHRVVGTDRSLVGYAGGLWRKKWLLNHENKIAHGMQTLF